VTARRRELLAVGGVVLATLLLLGWRIGVAPLGDWDEALTGARTLGLLETGDPLTVHMNGEPDFHKPPLYYALAAAASRIVGVNEAAMRLPGIAGGGALAAAMFLLGRWVDGPICGFAASLALVTTAMFVGHGRQAQPDMVLYATSVGAIVAFLANAPTLAGVLVGAALLTKGLAGALAPLVIGAWWLAARAGGDPQRREAMPLRSVAIAGAVATLLVAPWLAWNALRHTRGFETTFVGAEVTQRVVWTSRSTASARRSGSASPASPPRRSGCEAARSGAASPSSPRSSAPRSSRSRSRTRRTRTTCSSRRSPSRSASA
jgi:4-amino-4-deoxy-L-arabinose transferase-like glycosyltransferase